MPNERAPSLRWQRIDNHAVSGPYQIIWSVLGPKARCRLLFNHGVDVNGDPTWRQIGAGSLDDLKRVAANHAVRMIQKQKETG